MSRTTLQIYFASFAAFPTTGATSVVYVATDVNKTYRWSGSAYVTIGLWTDATYTTSTDPALNAAVTTAIVDANAGVIITTTGASNAQTLENPTTTTAWKSFTVVNNDTSTNAITVNGTSLAIASSRAYIWDGSAWVVVTPVTASQITNVPAGGIAGTTVQTAINELDTEKANLISPSFTTPTLGVASATSIATTTGMAVGWATVWTGGLAFPATAVAIADVNTLDDYEEGTWTPVFGGSGGTSGQTYTTQTGRYTKIGKLVTASFDCHLSAKGTITSWLQIQGLPFTTSASPAGGAYVTYWVNMTTSVINMFPRVEVSSTVCAMDMITAAATGTTGMATADIANNTQIIGMIIYQSA